MVSLRQRSSRPSYTSMAGLENLSDGESRSDNEAEGSGSGRRGPSRAGSDAGGSSGSDSGSDSISSGASSEFQMEVDDDGKKGKGRGKGKGKGRGRAAGEGKGKGKAARGARDGSGSAFEDDEDGSSEDISMDEESDDMPEPVEDDEGIEPMPTPRGTRGRGGGRGRGRGRGRGGRAAKQPEFSTLSAPALPLYAYASASGSTASSGNPHILPEAYRKIIGASAEVLTKNTQGGKKATPSQEKDYDKYRRFGVEGLAFGPPTPFVTSLAGRPRRADTQVKWTWEHADAERRKDARRDKLWNIEGAVPLAMPSEVWMGEGWWKGMYDAGEVGDGQTGPAGNKGKDTGRQKGWRLREDVRMGLDGVGRLSSSDIRILSRDQASAYLPAGKTIICHAGPHHCPTRIELPLFDCTRQKPDALGRESYIFSAGGPVWGMDWCPVPSSSSTQYMAISALRDIEDQPAIGTRRTSDELGGIQIWSFDPAKAIPARCEIVLCIKGAGVLDLKWMPLGARDEPDDLTPGLPKLGVIAAVQLDGSVAFYPVPHPEALRMASRIPEDEGTIFVNMDTPLLKLNLPDASATCLDWMTGTRLVVGLSNGHGVVWDVGKALRGEQAAQDVLPIAYMSISGTPVRSVAAARHPTSDNSGVARYDADPTYAVFGSYEGALTLADIRDPEGSVEVNKQRKPALAVAWCHQLASAVYTDVDGMTSIQRAFGGGKHRNNGITVSRGAVWSIATSDFHPNLAAASSDGSVVLGSTLLGFHRKRKGGMIYHRLFEMDYDKHTGEYRMTDNFLPQLMGFSLASDRMQPKSQRIAEENPEYIWSAAWMPEVGVHKVVWNCAGGLKEGGWLASGTASGLVRVDWIEGKLLR